MKKIAWNIDIGESIVNFNILFAQFNSEIFIFRIPGLMLTS